MPAVAPVRIPVELRALPRRTGAPAGPRVFRMARLVSVEGLGFGVPLPESLDERVAVSFALPDDPAPVQASAHVTVVDGDDGPQRLGATFDDIDEAARLRIDRYVTERNLAP